MNEKLEFFKTKITELAAKANTQIGEFNWGTHETTPDKQGLLHFEDGWYIYSNNERMESIFVGPMKDEEVIGYLCSAIFYIDAAEFAIDRRRMYEIMTHPVNGVSGVQSNIKKKLYELKKEIIEHKIDESKENTIPKI